MWSNENEGWKAPQNPKSARKKLSYGLFGFADENCAKVQDLSYCKCNLDLNKTYNSLIF